MSSGAGSSGAGSSGSGSPAGAVPPRADPRKAFRGPASACFVLEAVVLPLALPVMAKAEGGLTAAGITLVLGLTVGMIVGCVVVGKPWGLYYAVALQVVTIAGWVVSPALGVLGLVFGLVWAILLWMRQEVLRRQASWPDVDGRPAHAENGP